MQRQCESVTADQVLPTFNLVTIDELRVHSGMDDSCNRATAILLREKSHSLMKLVYIVLFVPYHSMHESIVSAGTFSANDV